MTMLFTNTFTYVYAGKKEKKSKNPRSSSLSPEFDAHVHLTFHRTNQPLPFPGYSQLYLYYEYLQARLSRLTRAASLIEHLSNRWRYHVCTIQLTEISRCSGRERRVQSCGPRRSVRWIKAGGRTQVALPAQLSHALSPLTWTLPGSSRSTSLQRSPSTSYAYRNRHYTHPSAHNPGCQMSAANWYISKQRA